MQVVPMSHAHSTGPLSMSSSPHLFHHHDQREQRQQQQQQRQQQQQQEQEQEQKQEQEQQEEQKPKTTKQLLLFHPVLVCNPRFDILRYCMVVASVN